MPLSPRKQKILCVTRFLLGRVLYERVMLRRRHGYWPHLRHPRSMNERIAHVKLFATPPDAPLLADKYRVREYVKAKGLESILNKVYFVGDDPDSIPFDELPQKYVIRFSHNTGSVIFIQDNAQTDREEIRRKCADQLATRFGYFTNEDWYLKIPPKIIIEEMLVDENYGIPPDYKFYIVDGKVGLISLTHNRFKEMNIRFYSPDWEPMNFEWGYPPGFIAPPPKKLEEMKAIALKLAEGQGFVRIDLYFLNDKEIRFSEITFADAAAWDSFTPPSADFELGRRLWNPPKSA